MREISIELAWMEIMNMTWFCHYPTQNEKPCGICKQCIIAIDEEFAWRTLIDRRMISFYFRKMFWPVKLSLRTQLINVGLFKAKKGILWLKSLWIYASNSFCSIHKD